MWRFGVLRELRRSRAVVWTKELIAVVNHRRTFGLAAETAFWLFLSLLPLAAVAGLFAARFSVNNWGALTPLLSSLPAATRQLISTELMTLGSWSDGTAGVWSAAVFIWLASSGVHSIFDSLELQVGATRPWWKKRLLAIGACFALSVAVALLAILGPGISGAMGWLGQWIPELRVAGAPTMTGSALRFGVSAAIVFGYTCGLYRLGVPPSARRHVPVVPGALLAVALELLFGFGYTFYLSKVGDGGAYLAGLAVIGVTMIGLYLFTTALLIGAVVNLKLSEDRALWRVACSTREQGGSPPSTQKEFVMATMKLVTGLAGTYATADAAVQRIMDCGHAGQDINMITTDDTRRPVVFDGRALTVAALVVGVVLGAVVGGVVGAVVVPLVARVAIALFPMVAIGEVAPIMATGLGLVAGGVAGGLIGALAAWGVPAQVVRAGTKVLKQGGFLIGVRAYSEEDAKMVRHILEDVGVTGISSQNG